MPSANAVALRALAMAFQRTGETRYRERADALVVAFSGLIQRSPSSFPYLLLGRAELESGDTGTRRYAARGKVAIAATGARRAARCDAPRARLRSRPKSRSTSPPAGTSTRRRRSTRA